MSIYLNTVRVLADRKTMPIGLLAIKTGVSISDMIEFLQKLEKLKIVELNNQEETVTLVTTSQIPPMEELYSLTD